jgi:Protein of unknown function (DUF3298)
MNQQIVNITHRFFLAVFFLSFLLLPACKRSSNPSQPATQTSASPAADQSHPAEGGTTPREVKHFKGSIGTTLDLQMKLVRSGDQLTGNYFYQKVGTKIELKGTIDQYGNLTLQEFDPTGKKQTGLFKGIWSPNNETGLISIAGIWSKPPGEKGEDKKTAFSVHEEPIFFSGDVEIVSKQIKESNKKLMYEVAAYYPQINGSSNPNTEKLNELMRVLVTRKVAEFRKEMVPTPDDEPRPEGSMGSDLNVAYSVALAQDDLTSIEFDVGSYYQGAAHPNSYSEVINYDLKNGKQLKLADLFKPGSNYLQSISKYCIEDLKKQAKGLVDDQIKSGASPTTKNYQSWTITRKGLGINFDAYQVGPYAAGPQFVLVPYSAIKDVINSDGPIGQLAK